MQGYVRLMDGVARACGVLAAWALLLACLISAGNATLRYTFSLGSNAWLEAQWYLFGLAVFAGAPLLLRLNEHVRVDVVYGGRSPRTKAWIDLLGLALVLLPVCVVTAWMAWPFAVESYLQQEHSPSAGGLLRWPIKAAIPAGFALLALQGLAELFKRVAFLRGDTAAARVDYERPLQ
ncbi:MAG: TRAP transporter small permease subunit [Aquabacterium sp.]|uniref:TRAP transporter small permease subunit n=1 Tax=Aquabacterium sp. TaxID=1872578 RepID=UPI0025CC270C|nr:TRAP transporter small permease subunit [uncultured Aquabacterium sp.]